MHDDLREGPQRRLARRHDSRSSPPTHSQIERKNRRGVIARRASVCPAANSTIGAFARLLPASVTPAGRAAGRAALTNWQHLCGHFHDLIQQRGTMTDISIPGGRIRSFVERIEHLDSELQELNESKKEVFAEAKGEGFDVKILKAVSYTHLRAH